MDIGFLFWLLMIFSLIFWGWGTWGSPNAYWPMGHGVLIFVLLFLLGLKAFGWPIHG